MRRTVVRIEMSLAEILLCVVTLLILLAMAGAIDTQQEIEDECVADGGHYDKEEKACHLRKATSLTV